MKHRQDEVAANLERAENSIAAAQLLFDQGFYDFAASRAYYAAFYAAYAALLGRQFETSKHGRCIAAFHQHFVKTDEIPREIGVSLNWLYSLREVADYGESRHVPRDDAAKALRAAVQFLAAVMGLEHLQ